MSDEQAVCGLCGEPMPAGEEMFKFHGYSGSCPKPPLPKEQPESLSDDRVRELWRSVTGPHAELTGPLIRFAALLFEAGRKQGGT
jgi:hypothetical protein